MTEDQARAFYAKFWQLHTDSQRGPSKSIAAAGESSTLCKEEPRLGLSSSRAPVYEDKEMIPLFKERIRPGMVVRWDAPRYAPVASSKFNLAVVLCPQHAAGENVRDVLGNKLSSDDGRDGQKYLCALVTPGALIETFEVHLWRQIVLDVREMETEVVLEYDAATRYYRTAV